MTMEEDRERTLASPRQVGFADWRARLDRERIAPVIAVAGSRGKTSVIRAVESIVREGGYRFASWTNRGVEIEGESQRGELGPWARALTRLSVGGLDVAIREMDWATVKTLGTAASSYPITAITNLCANSDACLISPEFLQARLSLERIRANSSPGRHLILNADDFMVVKEVQPESADRFLVGFSSDTPILRRHVQSDGDACWISGSTIMLHQHQETRPVVDLRWLSWTRGGSIPFAVQTALMATAIARCCGLGEDLIAAGLMSHDPRPESMPGSFNVFEIGSSKVVVDRPMPSWFLRMSVRAAAAMESGRKIHIAGPMTAVATGDLLEIGRLLGRGGGVMIVHGNWDDERLKLVRQGAAANDLPPIILQAADERSAIQQGMGMLRSDDVMLVLAEDPAAAIRVITRRIRRQANSSQETAGAA